MELERHIFYCSYNFRSWDGYLGALQLRLQLGLWQTACGDVSTTGILCYLRLFPMWFIKYTIWWSYDQHTSKFRATYDCWCNKCDNYAVSPVIHHSSGLEPSFKSSDEDCWEFCYSHLWILLHAWQVWQWYIRVPFTSIWAMGFLFPPDCHKKLASLKAILVRSYDSLTQWLSGVKSR